MKWEKFAILFVFIFLCSMAMAERTLICVINYPFQLWNQASTKIHVCLFQPDFKPAVGVEVVVDGKKVGITDDNGVCVFDFVPGDKPHVLTAMLQKNGIVYKVKKTFQCKARIAGYHVERLYLYTDRAIYNPGQTILIRCIAWVFKGEYHPIDKARIKIMLQDGKGHIYNGGYIDTNEYGVGAFEIDLPPNIDEGSYDLVVKYKESKESVPIKIERFVAPVIDIQHNLPRYLTEKQEILPLEIKLSFFAGGVMGKSKLKLAVLSFGREIFIFEPVEQKPGFYQFSLGKKQLDKIRYFLSKDQKFQIALTATDQYERSDTVTRDIMYSFRPYKATLESNKSRYRVNENVIITAKVRELDNRPASNIPLIFQVGSREWKKNTDSKGIASFSFTMGKHSLSAQLKTPSVSGTLTSLYLSLDAISKKVVTAKISTKAKIAAQISVSFDSEYIPVEKVIHVDLTDISGTIAAATTLPLSLNNGIWQAEGQIFSPTWGTMLINIYCCAVNKKYGKNLSPENVGMIVEGQKVTFQPKQKLAISFPGLKLRVKPGEKLRTKIKIKGPDKEYCLGVSMVDEAVLSLGDPMEKKPGDYFYSSELKSMTTTGSAALTWPVLDRNWGERTGDIAYQNWGWKKPGKIAGKKIKYKQNIEIALVIDSSGSMSPKLENLKIIIPSAIKNVHSAFPFSQIKIALIAYRAAEDDHTIQLIDFSTNIDSVYENLQNLEAKGGGDNYCTVCKYACGNPYQSKSGREEEVNRALADAVDKIAWTPGKKTIKAIYLFGDEPSKRKKQKETYRAICPRAVQKNIMINTIRCEGFASTEKEWKEIATLGNGRYTQITAGGNNPTAALDNQLQSLNMSMQSTFLKNKNGDDLVAHFQNNPNILEKINKEDLPGELQKLPVEKRKSELQKKLQMREKWKYEIQNLKRKRRWILAKNNKSDQSFNTFIIETLRRAAHNLQNK